MQIPGCQASQRHLHFSQLVPHPHPTALVIGPFLEKHSRTEETQAGAMCGAGGGRGRSELQQL